MKKIVLLIIAFLMVVSLSACQNNGNYETSGIKPAKLTEREKTLVSFNGSNCFVFDFAAPMKYKKVKMILEKYEFGKKTEETFTLYEDINDKEQTKGILAVSARAINDEEYQTNLWDMMISEGDGNRSAVSTCLPQNLKNAMNVWSVNSSENIIISDDEIILAICCYKTEGNGISSVSQEFYDDPDKNMKEIADFDLAYLVKCKFY